MSAREPEDFASEGEGSPALSPEQFSEAKAAFLQAQAMELHKRDDYLLRRFHDRPEIRVMVMQLLEGAEKPLPYETLADDLLVAHLQARNDATRSIEARGGSRIGPYHLLERLGEGGFGVVYLAEQEAPVRRYVALKVIKLGMDTARVIARFEAERQAIALMEHPGIAKVFDAGSTETGRPYFVMELIRGEPITSYCDRKQLSIPDRLNLFKKVCDALHHAHQKGVIHRDIKPSNVLVTETDAQAIPKIIDFGIAKATNSKLTEKTMFTEFRQMIGTPEYMSPEQAALSALELDSRTDVYSLGVILYELLTGVTPFESKRLRSAACGEMQRIIREEDPQRPSTRLSQTGSTETIAGMRSVSPGKLDSMLTGELDWVVMRCLEKSPGRRYDSAAELGREIERHLSGSPVEAVPPSRAYLIRKWLVRHREAAVVGGVLLLVVVLGLVGTSFGLIQAKQQQRIAAAETERAESQTYIAQMQLAWSALGEKPGRAKEFLNNAPPRYRGWEWHSLHSRLDLSFRTIEMPWPSGFTLDLERLNTFSVPHPNGQSVFSFFNRSGPVACERRSLTDGRLIMSIPFEIQNGESRHPARSRLSPDGEQVIFLLAATVPTEEISTRPFEIQIWDASQGFLLRTTEVDIPLDAEMIQVRNDGERVYYNIGTRLYSIAIGDPQSKTESVELAFPVVGAVCGPRNQLLFVYGSKGEAKVLHADGLSPFAELVGHTNMIRNAGFPPDASSIVTPSLDGTARIWDLSTASSTPTVLDVGVPLDRAWINEDGSFVVTESGSLTVWDAKTSVALARLTPESIVKRTSFIVPGQNVVAARDRDGSLRLWHLESMATVRLAEHSGHVNAARFTGPTGYIVSVGWDGWASNSTGCIRIWDAETGLHLAALGEPGGAAMSVDVSADGRYAVCRVTRGPRVGLRIIDLMTGMVRHVPGNSHAAAIHPTEPFVTAVWNSTYRRINLVTGQTEQSFIHTSSNQGSLLWVPGQTRWGRLISSVERGGMRSFDVIEQSTFVTTGNIAGESIAATNDQSELYVYNRTEETLDVYDTKTLEKHKSVKIGGLGGGRIEISVSGDRIACSSPEDQAVMAWDRNTLQRVFVFTNSGYVSDLAWNADGTRLIATWDKSIHIFDATPIGERAQKRADLTRSLQKTAGHASGESYKTSTSFANNRSSQIRILLDGIRLEVLPDGS